MHTLLERLLQADRRLVAPIGGSPKTSFADAYDLTKLNDYERSAYFMAYRASELGHALENTCVDDVTVCKCFGLESFTVEDGSAHIREGSISSEADLAWLRQQAPLRSPIVEHYVQPIRVFNRLATESQPKLSSKLIGGGCFGPFTVAGAMMGVNEIAARVITDPGFVEQLIEIITEFIIGLAQRCAEHGAEFFWIAEPLAIMLSGEDFTRFSGAAIERIFASVPVYGFLHVCGDTARLLPQLAATGAACLSVDYQVDMRDAAHRFPPEMVLMGNTNPVFVQQSSQAEVEAAVRRMYRSMRHFPNWIVSTGCLLPGDTPIENVNVFFAMAEHFPLQTPEFYRAVNELWHAMSLEQGPPDLVEIAGQQSDPVFLAALEETCVNWGRRFARRQVYLPQFLQKLQGLQQLLQARPNCVHGELWLEDQIFPLEQIKQGLIQVMMQTYKQA